jgi:hypothetical protein
MVQAQRPGGPAAEVQARAAHGEVGPRGGGDVAEEETGGHRRRKEGREMCWRGKNILLFYFILR